MLLAALSLLGGCGSQPEPGDTPRMPGSTPSVTKSTGAPGPGAGSLLRLPQAAEPTTLDPAQVQDGPTIELLMHVFEGLVQWSPENKLIPALAGKWEVSKDGKTYTFHLRKGAKFHNGREITAEDFVYSLTRTLDPKTVSPVAMVYLNDLAGAAEFHDGKATSVRGIAAPNAQTLKLTIDAPKAFFLAKLTYPTAYAVCKEAIAGTGGRVTEQSCIGTGAFRLQSYLRGDRIQLEGFGDYWDGAPKLGRIERRIVLDNQTRHDKFEAGEFDITDISMQTYRADKNNEKLKPLLHTFERPAVYYLALNQKAYPPFKDRRVRQAFAHAVDKTAILESVHEGLPRRAEGMIPFGVPGHDPDFKGLPFDPAKGKQLLAEAGFPEGKGLPPLKVSFRASVDDIKNTCVVVQQQLQKNLGVTVELDETEWTTFLKKRNDGVMPFYFLRWMADYLDPQNFVSTMLHSRAPENTLGYANPQFDRLSEMADIETDEKSRMANYRLAEGIAIQDAPWIPIYFQKDVELWNPKLQGVEDMALGHLPHKRTTLSP
jgi:ABC-type transport system substrate-binding protein